MSIAGKGGERIRALMAVVALGLAGGGCGSSHDSSGGAGVGGAGGSNQPRADGGINAIDGHMMTGVSNPPLTTPAVALEGGAAPSDRRPGASRRSRSSGLRRRDHDRP